MANQSNRHYKERLREIQALKGYSSGESVKKAASRSKARISEISKLNSNENLFVPKEKLISLLIDVSTRRRD